MKGQVRNRIQIQYATIYMTGLKCSCILATILRLLDTHAKELSDIIPIITYTAVFVYKLITGLCLGLNVWLSITSYMCTGINSQRMNSAIYDIFAKLSMHKDSVRFHLFHSCRKKK